MFDLQNRRYRVVKIDGALFAHATTCPHMLGPLQDATLEDGQVQCPWHGFRFDVRTGQCVSGQRCRLAPAPEICVDAGTGTVVARTKPGDSDRP